MTEDTSPPNVEDEETKDIHLFWSKQPVIKEDEEDVTEGYVDQTIPVTSPPDQPAPLPPGFSWSNIDVNDDSQLEEIYNFLSLHYVEDGQHRFRFRLPAKILRWALAVPDGIPEWVFGVRAKSGSLVGFISGIPQTIRLRDDVQKWCAVNFLCVHNKLRTKKLSPVLIFELARRVRVSKIYRAVFSGADVPSKHFTAAQYNHRPINLKKVNSCGFYPITKEKFTSCQRRFAIPQLVHGNCRLMKEEDIPSLVALLNASDSKYSFSIQFNEENVRHMFMPIKDLVFTYVIPGPSGIQAFFSFYMMEWTILEENSMSLTYLRSAYVWYTSGNVDQKALFADLVNKAANDAGADVINALSVAATNEALVANKFESGNRALKYYSYNYAVQSIDPTEVRYFFI